MDKKFRVIVSMIFILCGCDKVFMQQPKVSDLTGIYCLTLDSEKFLINNKKYKLPLKCLIELKSDYSISIQNLPDCATDGIGESKGTFLTGHGKWSIEKDILAYRLTVNVQKGWSLAEGGYIKWIGIRRWSPPYGLEIIIGDPDSGESILYERI